MRNIFILYMPKGNKEAMLHYQETIKRKVESDRIFRYIDYNLKSHLSNIFGKKPIAVWGSRASSSNRSRFETMTQGDDVLIVEGGTIKLLGKIAAKTINYHAAERRGLRRFSLTKGQHLSSAGPLLLLFRCLRLRPVPRPLLASGSQRPRYGVLLEGAVFPKLGI